MSAHVGQVVFTCDADRCSRWTRYGAFMRGFTGEGIPPVPSGWYLIFTAGSSQPGSPQAFCSWAHLQEAVAS